MTNNQLEKHTISVLVDNEFGTLSRVIGLFSSRGYNIDSLTVSEVDSGKGLSRITIITHASQEVVGQIMVLLQRIVPVRQVVDLTVESPHVEREVALIKLVDDDEHKRAQAQLVADRFGAHTIDSSPESFIFELTDTPEKIDKFIVLQQENGVREVCRTGVTAMARGVRRIEY